jgi:hypothetical protein
MLVIHAGIDISIASDIADVLSIFSPAILHWPFHDLDSHCFLSMKVLRLVYLCDGCGQFGGGGQHLYRQSPPSFPAPDFAAQWQFYLEEYDVCSAQHQ